jgi:hypothetical protein
MILCMLRSEASGKPVGDDEGGAALRKADQRILHEPPGLGLSRFDFSGLLGSIG